MAFTYALYAVSGSMLIWSFFHSREKTRMALKKAWKSFENIMPQFLVIILIIGMSLAAISPTTISKLLGNESGIVGMLIAGTLGSVTLIPGFVAFPLAAALLQNGAGIAQIAVFVSTLMMVGVVTLPVEFKYFGKKMALARNGLSLIFSFAMAFALEAIIRWIR
jgi:uncharacterized membrane protein YraQ (UPF0718 family)